MRERHQVNSSIIASKTDGYTNYFNIIDLPSDSWTMSKNYNNLILIDSGTFELTINSLDMQLEAGEYILIPKNAEFTTNHKNCNGTVIQFDEQFLYNDEDDYFTFLLFNLFKQNHIKYKLGTEQKEQISCFIKIINSEFRGKSTLNIVSHLFKSLLLKIEAHIKSTVSNENQSKLLVHNDNEHFIFMRFREMVEENFRSSYSVESYAKKLNISSKKLLEVSRRVGNDTPSEIIKQRIIREAKSLLQKNKYSIKQVANILGFEYAANFSQYFKKSTNQSPKDYRNSLSVTNKK